MNRFSPHYDHDEQRTTMSFDQEGSWVHVTEVGKLITLIADQSQALDTLKAERDEARAERDELAGRIANALA